MGDYYLVSGTLRKLDRVFIKKHLSGKEKNMKRAELESSCRIITDPLERRDARDAVRSKHKVSRRKPKRRGRRVPTHRSVPQITTAESRIARKAERVRRANAWKAKRDRRGATVADVARFLSKGSYGISKNIKFSHDVKTFEELREERARKRSERRDDGSSVMSVVSVV